MWRSRRPTSARNLLLPWIALVLLIGLVACGNDPEANVLVELLEDRPLHVPGGEPERGRAATQEYGCGACHTIPGVRGADAEVGPPLMGWANRHYIAGLLPNRPENLMLWIMNPQEVEPGTAMPDMGVTEPEARDIAAYLYTLD